MAKKFLLIFIFCLLASGCSISHSNKEYYCEQGILQGDTCRIDETSEIVLKCDSGEKLVDNICKYPIMTIAASVGDRSCAKGYSFYDPMCISDDGEEKIPSITCPEPENDGEEIIQGYLACFKRTCKEKDEEGNCIKYNSEEVEGELDYNCPSGTKQIYHSCRKAYYPVINYSCPKGELEEDKCVFYETHEAELTCPVDFTLNKDKNICEKTYYVDAFTR